MILLMRSEAFNGENFPVDLRLVHRSRNILSDFSLHFRCHSSLVEFQVSALDITLSSEEKAELNRATIP